MRKQLTPTKSMTGQTQPRRTNSNPAPLTKKRTDTRHQLLPCEAFGGARHLAGEANGTPLLTTNLLDTENKLMMVPGVQNYKRDVARLSRFHVGLSPVPFSDCDCERHRATCRDTGRDHPVTTQDSWQISVQLSGGYPTHPRLVHVLGRVQKKI